MQGVLDKAAMSRLFGVSVYVASRLHAIFWITNKNHRETGHGSGVGIVEGQAVVSQVFISYANEDTEFARKLAVAFEGQGWSVWWDKQIPPGMDYAQVIEKAVNDASCIVVLWSQHSINSRWVHTEAAFGADRHIVATVIVDDTPGEQIPFEFRRLQAVDLSDWQPGEPHSNFDLLANRVRSILNEPPQPVAPVRPERAASSAGGMASWKEAMTSLGEGKQKGFRIAALVSAMAGFGSCSEALDYGDSDLLIGSVLLLGVAAYLLHLGRKPA